VARHRQAARRQGARIGDERGTTFVFQENLVVEMRGAVRSCAKMVPIFDARTALQLQRAAAARSRVSGEFVPHLARADALAPAPRAVNPRPILDTGKGDQRRDEYDSARGGMPA